MLLCYILMMKLLLRLPLMCVGHGAVAPVAAAVVVVPAAVSVAWLELATLSLPLLLCVPTVPHLLSREKERSFVVVGGGGGGNSSHSCRELMVECTASYGGRPRNFIKWMELRRKGNMRGRGKRQNKSLIRPRLSVSLSLFVLCAVQYNEAITLSDITQLPERFYTSLR